MIANRRTFLTASAGFALARGLQGQFAVGGSSNTTRLDLAKIDRQRILRDAASALGRSPQPTSDASSDSFLQMTLDLPTLAAASQIDPENESKYAAKAAETLSAWFAAKAPLRLEIEGYEGLLEFAAMAEVALSLAFLPLASEATAGAKAWFTTYLKYLTTDRTALLARDAKDRAR